MTRGPTLSSEMLLELRQHATAINGANFIVVSGFVGTVAPSAYMQINPRAMLMLLDYVADLEKAVAEAQAADRLALDNPSAAWGKP
jgi:hypothetical protein